MSVKKLSGGLLVAEADGSPVGSVGSLVLPNDSVSLVGSVATVRQVPTAFIGCRVYNSGNISTTTGTDTTLTFDSERFDTDGFHSTSSLTGRITIPAGLGGKYEIGGDVAFAGNATGRRQAWIVLNGTTIIGFDARPAVTTDGPSATVVPVSCVYDLAAGDYVELHSLQTAGTLNVLASGNYSPEFWVVKLDSGKVGQGIGCKAYHSTTQSVTSATWTGLSLDSHEFDSDSYHSTSVNTSHLTVPAGLGGKYVAVGGAGFAANATGGRYLRFYKNGTTEVRAVSSQVKSDGSGTTMQQVVGVIDLAAGDYVELQAFQDSGGSLNVGTATTYYQTSFSLMRLDSGSAAGIVPSYIAPLHGNAHVTYQTVANGWAIYVPCVVSAACTITGIKVNIGASSGNLCVGLYDDSGNRLATSGATASPGTSWRTIAFTAPYSAPAGRYWIAVSMDNATISFSTAATAGPISGPGGCKFQSSGGYVLPATWTIAGDSNYAFNAIALVSGGWPT